ncbi:Conserved_hypothetical protein [Hexamita inflata]|uniref:Uncharacterized protein n=1 Tax=Hexamita inflata TaxID=28002 RepID=A0ABP1HIQ3_9EUKA
MNTITYQQGDLENLQLPPGSFVFSLSSTSQINSNIQVLRIYEHQTNILISCSQPVQIKYYDLRQTDSQNLSKLFFELVSLNLDELPFEEKRSVLILIVQTSLQLRKYQQAIDFVSKFENNEDRAMVYLILASQFDFSLKSRDACRCFLECIHSVKSDEDIIQQRALLASLPYNNIQFDMICVLRRFQQQTVKAIKQLYNITISCLTEFKNSAILYFIDLLFEINCQQYILDTKIIEIIHYFSMQKQFAGSADIQNELQKLQKTFVKVLTPMRTQKKIKILNLLLNTHMNNTGIIFVFIQNLILNLTNDVGNNYEIKKSLNETETIQMYNGLFQKFLYFNQNLRIPGALVITESIIMLFSALEINKGQFISCLITNFWSQNEFETIEAHQVTFSQPIRFNKYLADDILHTIHLLQLYGHKKEHQELYNDFCTSLLYGFCLRSVEILQNQQQVQESQLDPGQIFGVATEIYNFSLQFAPNTTIKYLEIFLNICSEFYSGYTGSEALLFQVKTAIQDYLTLCEKYSLKYNDQIVFRLLSELSNWVEYQLYDIYFELITQLLSLVTIDQNLAMKLFKKLAHSAIIPYSVLEQLVQSIMNIETNSLDILDKISDYLIINYLQVDIQFVSQFFFVYLNASAIQNSFNSQKLQYLLKIYIQYSNIIFGLQQYTFMGQIVASAVLFCLSSNIFDIIEQTTPFFDILQNPPSQFYFQITECIFSAGQLITSHCQDPNIDQFLIKLSDMADSQEIDTKIKKIKQITEHTPPTESVPNSRPCSGQNYSFNQQKDKCVLIKLSDLKCMPPYQDIEGIKIITEAPAIPFVFLIPHPTTKEQKKLIDLNELVDDIGNVEQLTENTLNEFVQQRPSSSHNKKPAFDTKRPMSAGSVPKVEDCDEPVISRSPRRHTQDLKKEIVEIFENWEEDGEEENLLDNLE